MALTDLWKSARESIQDKQIQQVLSFAGTGKLADGNATSSEFRTYLSSIPSDVLARYATECLTTTFDQSGFALQDIVNQIGRRLSFEAPMAHIVARKAWLASAAFGDRVWAMISWLKSKRQMPTGWIWAF